MVHHARANGREVRGHARPHRLDHSAGLVSRDDGTAAAQAQGGRGVARGAVRVQVAPAHAGGLDGDDDLARPGRGIGEFLDLELPLSEKDDAAHDGLTLPVCFVDIDRRSLPLPVLLTHGRPSG
jgi:hypothetical protein